MIRFFLVEDYDLIRLGLVSALSVYPNLQHAGEAESAEDALDMLASVETDVLIVDLGLPDMNGIQLIKEVKKRWPQVRIIVLTSHSQRNEVLDAISAGAHAYALKDIKPSRLAQVIETVHEGAAWLDPAVASLVMDTVASSTPLPDAPEAGQRSSTVEDLTERERDVLRLIVQGKTNQEISDLLSISIHTTKVHVGNILGKLAVNDRVQAVIKAMNEKII